MGARRQKRQGGARSGREKNRSKAGKLELHDGELRIVQANCMQSRKRFMTLLEDEKHGQNGMYAHILACTDPSLTIAFTNVGRYQYVLDLCPERPLLESDNPMDKRFAKKAARSNNPGEQEQQSINTVALSRPFFCVHKSIPRSSWHVEYHKDGNRNLAATLFLKTKSGEVAIHNVHNTNVPEEQINIDHLTSRFALSEHHLVVGDFNLHHPAWAGKLMNPVQASAKANQLNDKMALSEMKLVTIQGTTTFRRTNANKPSTASCIDLTFASTALKSKILSWGVDVKSRWEMSDHRPIRTVLNFQPSLDTTVRWNYSRTPLGAYQSMVASKMEEMCTCDLSSCDSLDQAAVKFIQSLEDCRDKCIPSRLANPPGKSRYPLDPNMRLTMQNEAITFAEPGPELDREASRVMRRRNHEARRIKSGQHYRHYAGLKSKAPNGVWALHKMAKRMVGPQHVSDMPPLRNETDGIVCETEEEKQKCFRDSIWTKTSDTPGAYNIRQPNVAPNRRQLDIDQSLDEQTVDRHIRNLPSGKAAGRDKIANEAIKMARLQLLKFITYFFRACFKLTYIPRIFKHANTVILPKSGKESYDSPKSWRPIALLSAVAKLLEKIAAERLKKVAIEHRLLPNTQYGAPGRSTTHAVQDILGVVYKAWSGKQKRKFKRASLRKLNKVTMMGLDISAAYDRVDPEKLLQVLADHAIPDWYLHLIHSFLSDRVTNLQLPRSVSELFYIYIGIPQGSPLSPLLFLFFAAPLLGEINNHPCTGVKVYAFAYVDDTYLVAVSSSYEKNCRGMEIVHEGIMKWATSADVKFSPPKYNLMHFKCPKDTDPDCRLLPNIQGLKENPHCLKVELKVLGVVVDHQLTWEAHITDIVAKVDKSLNYLRRVMGTVWGMNLMAARKFFLGKIRPTIAYACGAWFVHSPKQRLDCSLKRRQIQRLESLQYRCLKQISGALGNTSQRVLEKELNIESLRVFLYRTMISSRAKSLEIKRGPHRFVQDVQMPCKWENLKPTGYQLLDQEAQRLCKSAANSVLDKNKGNVDKFLKVWENPERRKGVINQLAQRDASMRSAEIWDQYRRERSVRHAERHRPLAIEGFWGIQSLQLYAGMTRAQSTMLLQCRTEFIGLNHFLNRMHAQRPLPGSPDPTSPESFELVPATCSCGHAKQTVFHMFIECPDLRGARRRLEDKLETVDFRLLLTVQGAVAADWAITYFKLPQFEAPRADSQFSEREGGD